MSKPQEANSDVLIWMDLEMTGLDPEADLIIEIASLATDGQLNKISDAPRW